MCSDGGSGTIYFKGPYDGERQPISQEEFDALESKYSNLPNPMQFNFIPIEQ
jgi:hypothetical protein